MTDRPAQDADYVAADNRSVWDQIGDSLASIVKRWAEAQCACSHDKDTHWRGEGECMFSTNVEVWACGCHEYRPTHNDGRES